MIDKQQKITPAYNAGANAYYDNVSVRTNPYFWLTESWHDWRNGFMSQMPIKSKNA